MIYQYYNQFTLSNELVESISSIISQKENVNYIDKSIVLTIPEHMGDFFITPSDDFNPYGGASNSKRKQATILVVI